MFYGPYMTFVIIGETIVIMIDVLLCLHASWVLLSQANVLHLRSKLIIHMKYISALLIIICLILSPGLLAADYSFSRIDGEQGLSQSHVKSIIQDSYGFMWFGTQNGLNRFDGVSMRLFTCYDPELKKGNDVISALYEDSDRTLWVGTDNGIYLFDPQQERFSFFAVKTGEGDQIADQWIENIVADKDSNIWIVAPNLGVYRYDRQHGTLSRYVLQKTDDKSKDFPQCICIDKDGEVWIGTNKAGIYLYDKEKDSFIQCLDRVGKNPLRDEFVFSLCDYDDQLVVGSYEGKLMKFDKSKHTCTVFDFPEVHYKIIRHVVCFGQDLWVGTQNGIYIINEEKGSVVHLSNQSGPFGLADNIIDRIYKDREGGIWVGTNFGGANYLPDRGINFEKYLPTGKPGSISGLRISELAVDGSGAIWIGTQDGGVNCFDPGSKTFTQPQSDSTRQNVLSLFADGKQIGVGYFKKGLDIISDGTLNSYSPSDLHLKEGSIYALYKDRSGSLWLGDGWSIYRSADNGKSVERMTQFGYAYMQDIYEDSRGIIWVATMGEGVFSFDPKKDEVRNFKYNEQDSTSIGTNQITGISEDSMGNVLFSSDRGGISRYNREQDNFTTYSVKDGLPDNVTYRILEDENRNLWFGTNKGLVCFHPETKAIRVYTIHDGLPDNQFCYKSAVKGRDGKFYFGTINGLIAFYPSPVKKNETVPSVYITRLMVDNKEQNFKHDRSVTLPYDLSTIDIAFAALSFTSPRSNRYAYKMEGVDNDWVQTPIAMASYSKLSPGKYLFKVKGSNNDGVWNEQETTLAIRILSPWWLSYPSIMLYLIIIAGTFYVGFRYNRNLRPIETEKPTLQPACNQEMSPADKEFLNRVTKLVYDHMSESDFTVEKMADLACMSRSNLHRKIKSLSGLTTLDFIRELKLKRAAELIQEGKYTIGDISERIGIQSPAYFSRIFQKQFGVSPKEFARQNKYTFKEKT